MSTVSWCFDKGKSDFPYNDDRYGLLINQIASKESSAGGNNYQLIVSCSLLYRDINPMIAVIFIIFTKKLLGNKTESQMLWWQYLHLLSETMQTAQNNKLSVAFIYKRIIFILSNTCRGLIQLKKKRSWGRKK